MLDPIKAIESTGEIVEELEGSLANLRDELRRIEREWRQLGRYGAQRSDHAAKLLGSIRSDLQGIASFANAVDQQIAEMESAPFVEA